MMIQQKAIATNKLIFDFLFILFEICTMDIFLIVLALFFVILGVIGSFLPILPGPITSWFGFFILVPSIASLSFFLWTSFNLIPRALNHHEWYNEKFKNYPKNRKAVIPFIL